MDEIVKMLENSSGIAEDANDNSGDVLESQDSDDFLKDLIYNIGEREE